MSNGGAWWIMEPMEAQAHVLEFHRTHFDVDFQTFDDNLFSMFLQQIIESCSYRQSFRRSIKVKFIVIENFSLFPS